MRHRLPTRTIPGTTSLLVTVSVIQGCLFFEHCKRDGDDDCSALTQPELIPNQPPTVRTTAPEDSLSFSEGEPITFQAFMSDPEDGSGYAHPRQMRWSSDRDGDLGIGSPLVVTLTAGVHAVTVSVSDWEGLSATDVLSVRVMPASYRGVNRAPTPTITLPVGT